MARYEADVPKQGRRNASENRMGEIVQQVQPPARKRESSLAGVGRSSINGPASAALTEPTGIKGAESIQNLITGGGMSGA